MLKLKLSDPTRVEKKIREVVLGDKGEVLLERTYQRGTYYPPQSIIWYGSESFTERVIGYLPVEALRNPTQSNDFRSRSNLLLLTNEASVGLTPVFIRNGLFNVEAKILYDSCIEEIVTDFDTSSIPAKQIEKESNPISK
jgi:hypothetical protein